MNELRTIKAFDYDEIKKCIEGTSDETKIYVGCDSNKRRKKVRFVTVIVVHFEGNKGARVFDQIEIHNGKLPFEKRLWEEVVLSATCASEISEAVGIREFEVHLDLNSNADYKSNRLVAGAVGYINSLQFTAKVKPEAFAASHVADAITKNKGGFVWPVEKKTA